MTNLLKKQFCLKQACLDLDLNLILKKNKEIILGLTKAIHFVDLKLWSIQLSALY